MPIITELYAFCSQSIPGDEGIVALFEGEGWLPMVGADMDRVESLKKMAITLGKRSATSVVLKRFKLISEKVVYEAKPG